ncbi:MAG: HAD-IIIA family hydrolase [Clostridia bacterium]|nr:HAD-IIIA family hydrolase [Clostridia bacterium]
MQAVIMAGGKGTRLSSVTKDVPKPMVDFCKKPLLEYMIENLKENGVTDIILVIGHLGSVIENYFGTGKNFGVNIRYFREQSPLGTAGALPQIKNTLEDTFILAFGDLFVNIDFKKFYDFHKKKGSKITLFAHPNSHPFDSDIIVTDSCDRVTGWSYKKDERNGYYKNLVNAGLYVIDKSILPQSYAGKLDLEKDIIIPEIKSGGIFAYCSSEYVKDIGTPERLYKVEKDYKNGIPQKRNLKNRQKCIFLDRDGTINRYVGLLKNIDDMELLPGAAEAIKKINESEYLAVCITNQPVVARGDVTLSGLEEINNKMHTLLGENGAYLDGLYFCPHHPDSGFEGEVKELKIECDCRKPKTGLVKAAQERFNIDTENSWFIGDTYMDILTGINSGAKTVLLKSGAEDKFEKYKCEPDFTADNLLSAVKIILKGEEQ